ncbi:LOW QUALITY PROTEIN: odorant receptor 13a-like [Apis dorsata]|uniref:LOW QUALITY PROTEIN: odorant receptor 13a-like n=1 Tax=Apis dorsata TaxID=7462 RepID=UPI00129303FF|nr:LOW QUALITY PROTEIN: odorant receptor 13a-like [Apis dorsata]
MQTEYQLDISINLSTFFLKNVGVWISHDPGEQRRMRMLLICTVWMLLLGIVINTRDLYFTLLYNGDILYVVTNNITLIISLVKICNIIIYKGKFLNLIVNMQENFWNVNYDYHEKEILDDCKKICIFFISSVTTIAICAIISYLMTPFIAQSGSNESERMFPFNIWINLPLTRTPYYEIIFLIQAICLYYIGISSFCFDNIFCIMAVHLAGQFRILQYRLTKLCDTEQKIREKDSQSTLTKQMHKFYEQFKKCVQHHQALINYYQNLENVYTMITLGQVLVFSVLICLFGYQVLVATASFARRSIFVFLLSGSMFLLFLFIYFMVTYSCNGVIEHSDKVAIGAYSALWTIMPMDKFGKMLRKDLIMVIERSRRVCYLTANGFFPVSLETYTKILSTAVSYFTLLNNRIENANGL